MEAQRRVIIIGSGPSGYTAAVYLARARLEPLLFSGKEIGGQLMYTTEVENFPGFSQGIIGPKLMMEMRAQAERFGTTIRDELVEKVEKVENGFRVTAKGVTYEAQAILIATGAQSRMLGLENEKELLGRGLSTCAVCDAPFFRDQVVYVVGGGDSAMEDTLALAKFAKEVYVVHRRDSFRASRIMQERVLEHPSIKVLWETAPVTLGTDGKRLTTVSLKNLKTNEVTEHPAGGIFYAIGHIPTTSFLQGVVDLNEEGYITTRLGLDTKSVALAQANMAENGRVLFPSMTSVEGIFAAGDCVDFMYRQAVTAAAFGTMAALDVERWLERQAEA